MSATGISPRARALRVTLKLLSAFALLAAVMVSARYVLFAGAASEAAVLTVDLHDLPPRGAREVTSSGRSILILHRDAGMLGAIRDAASPLYDPESRLSTQPAHSRNALRSQRPEYFVVWLSAPDLGCPVQLVENGFRDTCRGSRYDFAGRVLEGEPSKRNLIVPEYRIDAGLLKLGAEE